MESSQLWIKLIQLHELVWKDLLYFKKKRDCWISDMDLNCELVFFATLLGKGALEHERFSRHCRSSLLGGCVDNGGRKTMVRAQSPLEEWLLGSIDIRNHDDITHKICTGSCYIYIYIYPFSVWFQSNPHEEKSLSTIIVVDVKTSPFVVP